MNRGLKVAVECIAIDGVKSMRYSCRFFKNNFPRLTAGLLFLLVFLPGCITPIITKQLSPISYTQKEIARRTIHHIIEDSQKFTGVKLDVHVTDKYFSFSYFIIRVCIKLREL